MIANPFQKLVLDPKSKVQKYAIAIGAAIFSILLTYSLKNYLHARIFFVSFSLTAFVSLSCGFWPGFVSVILVTIGLAELIYPPAFSFGPFTDADILELILFAVTACGIAFLAAVIQKQNQKLKEERKLRESFVNTLAHDLRNPLCAARLSLQVLEKSIDPEQRKKLVSQGKQNMDRMDKMIQNLLDANRLKAGEELPLTLEAVNLNPLLESVVMDSCTRFGERVKFATEQPIKGFWSAEGIRRIIENLVNNAIKYGNTETPVTVSSHLLKGQVLIKVHNFGPPLSAKDRNLLFTPFFRTAGAKRSGKAGWGLGLTLVHGLTQALHGKVEVTSDAVNGTAFLIKLPLDSQHGFKN